MLHVELRWLSKCCIIYLFFVTDVICINFFFYKSNGKSLPGEYYGKIFLLSMDEWMTEKTLFVE